MAHAIQTDEVVADHYRDVDPLTMHPQTVSVERMAHVSYRINDRVFWTKKPVRIYEGETILTNGETEIRARCGNAISMAPLLPTSDDEPESTEFDALTDTGPTLVAFDLIPSGVPSALAQSVGDFGGDEQSVAPLVPPFGIGAGGYASGANHGQANAAIPEDAPLDMATAPSGRCTPTSGMNAHRECRMANERAAWLWAIRVRSIFPSSTPYSIRLNPVRLDSIRLHSIRLDLIRLDSIRPDLIHLIPVPLCSSPCSAPNSIRRRSL